MLIGMLLEYNPSPPFNCGHPTTAEGPIVDHLRNRQAAVQNERRAIAKRAAAYFCA